MEVSFNRFNHFESSDIYLCNPNKQELGVVLGTATCTLRLNDISELTLEVQKYVKNSKGEKIVQPCYDLLQGKRLLLVDKIGYFEITRTVENNDDNGVYKTVSAESHQTTFKGKLGFTTEERVYKFFNSADPYDEHYNSEDLGSVPSVVGQLYQQLGVKVDLQDQDNEVTTDYDYWTITYIDDILRYGEFEDDAMYRSFADNQTNGYDFMVNDVENAFEMIWIFDFLHHAIKAKLITSITTPTDIYLSFDNLMQTLELTENAENIKTVLSCNGGDLDIRTVNPMGTNYIVNFDYYKDPDGKWMSKELIEALDKWEELYKSKETDFVNLVKELREKYEQQTKYQNIITNTQLRIDELNNARDQFILNYPLLAETFYDGELSADPNSQFHTSQLNVSQRFVCYQKSPSVENGKLVFATVGRNCTLADGYNDNYLYFQDNDTNTYLKLIKNENGLVGIERYGQYDAISQWSGASENSGLIIVGETVNIGDTSLQEGSVFYVNPFVRNDKTNYLCYKEPPKLVKGKFDYGDQVPLASSFDNCVNAGYLYFRNGSDDNYCKLNQSAEVDVETNAATYYASGFTRYTTMEFVTTWIDLQEQYNKSIENSNNSLQEEIDSIVAEMQNISKECNIQDYIRNYDETGKLYNELNCYWIEGTYENENLAVLDDTTMEETIDLAMQLKEAGEYQLKRVSQPSFSFTISTLDFTKLPQFKQFTHQLKLGRTISVEKASGLIYIPAVTEITFDLDNAEEFTMTFSNSLKLNENEFTFMDLVAQSAKVADGVISNWKDLLDYAKHKKDISTLIANPLDRSLRAAMTNMVNQEFTVDTTGILGRKYEDDSHTLFLDEQMRIMNNTILFTDDNWKTVKTALGKIYYNDLEGNEQSAYGLIAQTIVGRLVMSETLNICNKDSSVVINADGINILHDGKTVFTADNAGNLSLVGHVEATSGSFTGHIDATSGTFKGRIEAEEGHIANIELRREDHEGGALEGLYSDNFRLVCGEYLNTQHQSQNYTGLYFWERYDTSGNPIYSTVINTHGATIENISSNEIYSDTASFNQLGAETARIDSQLEIGSIMINQDSIVHNSTGVALKFGQTQASPTSFTATVSVSGDYIVVTTNKPLLSDRSFSVKAIPGYWFDNSEHGFTVTVLRGTTSGRCYVGWFWGINSVYFNGGGTSLTFKQTASGGRTLFIDGNIIPAENDAYTLGQEGQGYARLYCNTIYNTGGGDIMSSDKNKKKDIKDLDERYSNLFDLLRPVAFKFKDGTSGRFHTGLIANEVYDAINESRLTTQEAAFYCSWEDSVGNEVCGIRYTELIALAIKEIQTLKKRIKQLENINDIKKEKL